MLPTNILRGTKSVSKYIGRAGLQELFHRQNFYISAFFRREKTFYSGNNIATTETLRLAEGRTSLCVACTVLSCLQGMQPSLYLLGFLYSLHFHLNSCRQYVHTRLPLQIHTSIIMRFTSLDAFATIMSTVHSFPALLHPRTFLSGSAMCTCSTRVASPSDIEKRSARPHL